MLGAIYHYLKSQRPKLEMKDMMGAITELTDMERKVLELRMPWSLEETAVKLDVSRQRIFQLENAAFNKLLKLL